MKIPAPIALLAVAILVGSTAALHAAAPGSERSTASYQRFVVELLDPPLALYEGQELSVDGPRGPRRMAATAPEVTREPRLNVRSPESRAYTSYLKERQEAFLAEAEALLGRKPEVTHSYQNATNGLAIHVTPDEAELLAESPLVRHVSPDVTYRLDTYAGPKWLGAEALWNGDVGFPASRGEGVVVGNLDTGINWDHPSFSDAGYGYINPFGDGIGLCSDPEVECNDKLVGVWDFVEDNPNTEDWVEENTKGKDNDGHGSHTAGIAVGAPVNVTIDGAVSTTLSGVAPRASLVSYRVCYKGEPSTADSEGCSGSAILAAIDQAISDGVDVINYSIGGDPRDPWGGGTADRAFLSARSAGIFIASSAGNAGPNESTISSPATAPWIMAVGNATHNAIFGNVLSDFSGGSLPAPSPMAGASLTDGTGKLVIVHARDFGYPLCGVGEAELQPSCAGNTGASNPWAGSKPFNGEIVVCDRGTYGRIEKSKNLLLAGAGGYVLANTEQQGESIVADNHCLPATHVGANDGNDLREWLAAGSGHGASITGMGLTEFDGVADELSFSSSRGPAIAPVQDTLKPNLIAPGTAIMAAGYQGSGFLTLSGTSMASPHVAGAAALLKSVHPDWNVSQLSSTLQTTATLELAKDENGAPATPEQAGAGRPQLEEAVQAGLYLDVSGSDFAAANPSLGGDPIELNLPGLVDSQCTASCSFTRTVTDMMGGGDWTVSPVDFPAGTQVSVTPSQFSLGSGASRELGITIEVGPTGIVGDWVSGKIRLSAAGSSDVELTVSVYSDGGSLPEEWTIVADDDAGSTGFGLTGLVRLQEATFIAGTPVNPQSRTETLVEDPSNSDPYDGGSGVFTQWYDLPEGALWLHAATLASTADDLDLFVGRDQDGDNRADEWEELCSSTTPQDIERCDLYDLPAGRYWIVAQNWSGTEVSGDAVTLRHAAVEPADSSALAVSGPGTVDTNQPFTVRLSWDNFKGLPGEDWLSAVGVGSNAAQPNNIGVIPVTLTRSALESVETFPLMNGRTHALSLAANGRHDRIFIDVPPGVSGLTITASGATNEQSNALQLELVRQSFDESLAEAPYALPAGDGPVIGSASGAGGVGPIVAVAGGVQPGRWYAVLSNSSGSPASVTIQAEVNSSGDPIDFHRGLWLPSTRPGLGQGYDYNTGGGSRSLIWYTYDEFGLPAWYIAGAPETDGNIWTSEIFRVTNNGETDDGATQQLMPVGYLSITNLARQDALFSFTLYGESGFDRMRPLAASTCPDVNGQPANYTGIWFRGSSGLGGASILVNDLTQAQIHYLFDENGEPRWLFAQDPENNDPLDPEIPILQFHGFCAVCEPAEVDFERVGTLGRGFDSETSGFWILDYSFDAPPSGTVERTDEVIRLTDPIECE
ncbi:MAG: S8 family serine peptidase [Gammaproteobacteria bacterium]|nr:S8 family serine peptidase [Gammaproteobacteria bacterium]